MSDEIKAREIAQHFAQETNSIEHCGYMSACCMASYKNQQWFKAMKSVCVHYSMEYCWIEKPAKQCSIEHCKYLKQYGNLSNNNMAICDSRCNI